MLLSKFIPVNLTVYIGAAIAILSSMFYYVAYKPQGIHFILFSSTIVLVILSIIAFFMGAHNEWPQQLLPLTLEMTVILPLLILFLNRKRYSMIPYKHKAASGLKGQMCVTTLTLCCIRIFFGLATIHFAFIAIGLIFTRSPDNGFMRFMLHIAPVFVCITSMIVEQIEIQILRSVKAPEFVPVVTPQGEVIGGIDKILANEYKNEYIHPIIRIAVVNYNMLFLAKRSLQRVIDKGKTDILLETYLLFKEDIRSGVERLLKETFPQAWKDLKPEFSIKYKFRNEETDRLVYLFILDLGTADGLLCSPKVENGKLWTFQQIEFNLNRNYFSEMFENEYDHLKQIMETRGIYKEA